MSIRLKGSPGSLFLFYAIRVSQITMIFLYLNRHSKLSYMKKELTVTVPGMAGEEGLGVACREGNLFRNDPSLEDLYKDGFRVYNYSIVGDEEDEQHRHRTKVKVFLKK